MAATVDLRELLVLLVLRVVRIGHPLARWPETPQYMQRPLSLQRFRSSGVRGPQRIASISMGAEPEVEEGVEGVDELVGGVEE